MASVTAATAAAAHTVRQLPSSSAQRDLLRDSRRDVLDYRHRDRHCDAAAPSWSSSPELPTASRFLRQVSRRPGFACSAGEPDQEFVAIDEETERELEYQALQEAKAASYEFPEKYKHSIMAPTMPTPIFDSQEVWDLLHEAVTDTADQHYKAFFSSTIGGIILDPALMMMHVDDHMVHRGHGVFELVVISDGSIYQLEQHLSRLIESAGRAAIFTPMSLPQMMRTVLETAGAACIPNGRIKLWMSAGRGGFGLSSDECPTSAFHCMVYTDTGPGLDHTKGWRVKTTPVPVKQDYFARLKSVNYLENALAAMDANVEGFDTGIFVDKDGFLCGGPDANIAIVTKEDVLVTPPFDKALPGLTMQRIIEIAPEFISKGILKNLLSVEQRPISLEEAKTAKEVLLTSTSLIVQGVTEWDEDIINNGEVGIVSVSLYAMLMRDRNPSDKQGSLLQVPYGHATGMNINTEDNDDLVGRQFGSASGPYND